jgi:hypothetical protein
MLSCSTLDWYQGDVKDAFYRCCDDGETPPPAQPAFDPNNLVCPSMKMRVDDRGDLTQIYRGTNSIVCASQPKLIGTEPSNEFFFDIRKELSSSQKSHLCSIISRLRVNEEDESNRMISTQIRFANPSSTRTPVIVSHYSRPKGEDIGFESESTEAKMQCSNALAERREVLGDLLRAEIYEDMCVNEYIDSQSVFCAGDGRREKGMSEITADLRSRLGEANRVMQQACSNFTNQELKDLMGTVIELATSSDKRLNDAAASVCAAIPNMYWRRFNNSRSEIPSNLFPQSTDSDCAEPEDFSLRLPDRSKSLNNFINPYKAMTQWRRRKNLRSCRNQAVDRYLGSMTEISKMEFMSNPMSGNAKEMQTSDAYNFINVCRNLSMDSVMINRSSGKIGTGVLGSEFRQLVENRQFLRPAASGDLALKDGEFLNWADNDKGFELLENVDFNSIMSSHEDETNRKLLCELEDPATPEKSIMPVFSNNPFMVAYTIARSMTPAGDAPTPSFLEDSYPLGQMSKEECLVWPS